MAQARKDLSSSAEIARIAREQYQLVNPGQQAYEVLPPTRASKAGTTYAGDPALKGPVAPSSASVLPPGSETGTTQSTAGARHRHRHGAWHPARNPRHSRAASSAACSPRSNSGVEDRRATSSAPRRHRRTSMR